MKFRTFRRQDRRSASRTAHIALTPMVICYSAEFVRTARLQSGVRVTLHIDDEGYQLGLEFHRDLTRPDCFRLCFPEGVNGKRRASGVTSAFGAVVARYAWVRRVVDRPDIVSKRFVPVRDGRLWIVHLGPTFELEDNRDGLGIPTGARGIYRYVRSATGEVVYIGRGAIRNRLRHPTRAAWGFDRVQYSLLADHGEQNRWERHWLEKHREVHGKLPEYNRI